jgi:hypothetical protein
MESITVTISTGNRKYFFKKIKELTNKTHNFLDSYIIIQVIYMVFRHIYI